jgi:hypothetical protein
MASVVAGAALAGTQAGAAVTFLVTIAAAVVDAYVVMPLLQGNPEQLRAPRLADVAVGSNDPGAPRITAIGQRVRVPTHIIWQDQKVLEQSIGGGTKKGTAVQLRRTYFDCAIALNDRRTERLVQLIGNGKLLLWEDRNTVYITSRNISVDEDTGTPGVTYLRLRMSSLLDPDFADKFQTGDRVKLTNFTSSAGPDINGWTWEVAYVAPHGEGGLPSGMLLLPRTGQTMGGIVATANQAPPGRVARNDEEALPHYDQNPKILFTTAQTPIIPNGIELFFPPEVAQRSLQIGALYFIANLRLVSNGTLLWPGWTFRCFLIQGTGIGTRVWFAVVSQTPPITGWPGFQAAGGQGPVEMISDEYRPNVVPVQNSTAFGFFPATFNPLDHYREGSDTQTALDLMVDKLGVGEVPAYRGVAIQGIDDFYVNDFGNQLPFSLEALIDVDQDMTWQEAIVTVCERGNVPPHVVETSGVDSVPFDGMYIRGANVTGVALQPLLIARQIVTQERDGTLSFFEIKNAEVVAIENNGISHLGAIRYGDAREDNNITRRHAAVEQLSTSVGVRHQDPDNQYADGFQHFGLRNPRGVDHAKESTVNLNTLVLSRRDARNLCATLLRREWINSTQFEVVLPRCYLYLLENDCITGTDDDGTDFVGRIIQRDIGANLLVKLVCLEEVLEDIVAGSPPQPAYENPSFVPKPIPLFHPVFIVTSSSLSDGETDQPGVYVAVPRTGPVWTGATVYESEAGAGDWTPIATFSTPSVVGYIDEPLPADPEAFVAGIRWPNGPTVGIEQPHVRIFHGGMESVTDEQVAAGENWIAVYNPETDGWEVIGISEATQDPVDPSIWYLSIAYRGMRGTLAHSLHEKPRGTPFVVLSTAQFIPYPGNRSARQMAYKAVPPTGVIADAPPTAVRLRAVNATPSPVRKLTKTLDGSNNATISVALRGSRLNQPELDFESEHPMQETGEEFVFVIYDPTGALIRRRKRLLFRGSGLMLQRDRSVVYTAAEQAEDGYTPGAGVWLAVQQVGQYGTSDAVPTMI